MSDDRFQAILNATTTGFPDLGERVGQLGQRLDGLGERISQLDQRIGNIDHRVDSLDERLERIDRLRDSVWEQKQRIDRFVHVSERMEIKVDRVHDDMHDVNERLTTLDTGFITWAQMVSNQQVRLARFDTRFSLIEKRYDLREGPQPGTDPTH